MIDYLTHVEEDKKPKMRILLDKVFSVEKRRVTESTDFYDPYEQEIAESILNRFTDISYLKSNGLTFGERMSYIILPYEREVDLEDFFVVLKIESKTGNLKHPDYMGAILNQGIVREKIGDIIVNKSDAYVVLKKGVSDFLECNLEKVRREKVSVSRVDFDEVPKPEKSYTEKIITVSSMRVDIILSHALGLSRSKSENLVKSNSVKVNFKECIDKGKDVEVGSMISCRGFGRFEVAEEVGKSAKGKHRLLIKKLVD
ncbi:MAG: hypothetical protein GX219_04900 [Tissierellia bacterium]|nr:hypothetical protein [Tissierellia bacterium]